MYIAIFEGHLCQGNFTPVVTRLGPTLVDATLELHTAMTNTFLPSAVKFHYQFNLRDLSAVTQVSLYDLTKLLYERLYGQKRAMDCMVCCTIAPPKA